MLRPRLVAFALFVLSAQAALPSYAERNLPRPPGTTRYAPMVTQLKALLAYDKARGGGRMQLSSIGRSVKGRDIWMVTLHDEATTLTPTDGGAGDAPVLNAVADATPPKRVFYLCRQHGHEPASTEGALAFVRDLVRAAPDSPLADDLRRVTVYVVPMANPDGAEAFLRHNAHDVDLNRDWLRRTQPETQSWYRTVMALKPDLMTDQHELYPDDGRGDFTETAGEGCGASQALIETCAGTATTVKASMNAAGFPITNHWITDHHPARLAHRYACVVAGVPTILFETERLSGSGRNVAARGRAHYQFMVTVLRDAAGERDALLAEAASQTQVGRGTLPASRHKPFQRQAPVGDPSSGAPEPQPGADTKGGE